MHIENKIIECTQHYENEGVRKSLGELRSDLKYLSVISNGAEIDKNEHREIMDFLLIHYNYWQDKINYRKFYHDVLDKPKIFFYSVKYQVCNGVFYIWNTCYFFYKFTEGFSIFKFPNHQSI